MATGVKESLQGLCRKLEVPVVVVFADCCMRLSAQPAFYNELVANCFSACVCVDLYLLTPPQTPVCIESLSYPALQTGGELRYLPDFNAQR